MDVNAWPANPIIFEIQTWPWLAELGRGRALSLAEVPDAEWDAIAAWGFDAVWLMGVFERSPISQHIARTHPDLQPEFHRALSDLSPADVVGSPYCVRRYVVDEHLGGRDGLRVARQALARRGLRLLLDFVPNHTARDCPWISEHSDYYVHGTRDDLQAKPDEFFETDGHVLTCGRDPYLPAWTDVAQVNAYAPGLRQAAIATLDDLAGECDGVRCDMAMLLMNDVFGRTWSGRVGTPPATDYWPEVIGATRARHPQFLFVAEAYWNLEPELLRQGFDYCYDKGLYDRLVHGQAQVLRAHLRDAQQQARTVHFIENHDEARAATAFAFGKERAAALAALTLPGTRLLHQGQFEGRKIRIPVQLGRWPEESQDLELRDFYRRLLQALRLPALSGEWELCDVAGWPGQHHPSSLVAWCWQRDEQRVAIVINLAAERAQAHVRMPWPELNGHTWRLRDPLSGAIYDRAGAEMCNPGLYVDLRGWGFHFMTFEQFA
jgi:glycosidase